MLITSVRQGKMKTKDRQTQLLLVRCHLNNITRATINRHGHKINRSRGYKA